MIRQTISAIKGRWFSLPLAPHISQAQEEMGRKHFTPGFPPPPLSLPLYSWFLLNILFQPRLTIFSQNCSLMAMSKRHQLDNVRKVALHPSAMSL